MLIFFSRWEMFFGVNFLFFCSVVSVLGRLVGVFCLSMIFLILRFNMVFRIVGLLFMVRMIIDRFGKWCLMYLIKVILLLYLFFGMERLVINICVFNFGRLLINVVEFLNLLIIFIYLICLSDLWILNSIIGWLLVIIMFILFMYWVILL